jgi:4'-phosphopantetheinyl transferase EntD
MFLPTKYTFTFSEKESVWRAAHSQRGSLNAYAEDILTKKNSRKGRVSFEGISEEGEFIYIYMLTNLLLIFNFQN